MEKKETCMYFMYSQISIYNLSLIVSLYTLKDNNHLQANWTGFIQSEGSALKTTKYKSDKSSAAYITTD